jgi:uncharacterized membrane protein YdcZ (DUF606 family)
VKQTTNIVIYGMIMIMIVVSVIITATLWDNYGLFVEKYEIRMVKPSTMGLVLGYTPMWHYVE